MALPPGHQSPDLEVLVPGRDTFPVALHRCVHTSERNESRLQLAQPVHRVEPAALGGAITAKLSGWLLVRGLLALPKETWQ